MSSEESGDTLGLFDNSPLDRLMSRFGLAGKERRARIRGILFWIGVTWLPLFVFAILGRLTGESAPRVLFQEDYSVHVRYLLVVPFLFAVEEHVRRRVDSTIRIIRERRILEGERFNSLQRTIAHVRALASAYSSDIGLLVIAFALIRNKALIDLPQEVLTWRTMDVFWASVANAWYYWVSLPIYYWMVLRWLWRYFLWSTFILRIPFLAPTLQPLHPDHVGGLEFIATRHADFVMLAMSISTVASANVAESVVFGGEVLDKFFPLIATFLVVMTLINFLPLLTFTPALIRCRKEGIHKYGAFAALYTRSFAERWFNPGAKGASEEMLGTPDIQSLNDLMGSFEEVYNMRIVLMSHRLLLLYASLVAAPILPLVLFKVPLTELLESVAKVFL